MFEIMDVITGWVIPVGLILIIISGIVTVCEVFKERNDKRETEKRSLLSAMFAAAYPIDDGESEDEYSERIHTAVGLYLREQENKLFEETIEEYSILSGKRVVYNPRNTGLNVKIPRVTSDDLSESVQTA